MELFVQSTPYRPIHHAKRPIGKLFEDIAHDHSSIENSDIDILGITHSNLLEEPSKLSICIESSDQESDQQAVSNISKSQVSLRQTIFNNTSNVDGDPFQCSDSDSCSDQPNCDSDSESTISTS